MREFVKPNIFVSACIEFDECRYDGTKISDIFVRRLQEVTNVIRVCPELSIGLSSPRDALRLVERKDEERKLLSTNYGDDYTDKMREFSSRYAENLKNKDIDGFIMKAKSPTCGISSTKIYYDIGKAHVKSGKNPGMFTEYLMDAFPGVPMESERRLSNYQIRDRFFTQLFSLADFKRITKTKELVDFHTRYKYLFMTYNQSKLKVLGSIVANHDHLPFDEVKQKYQNGLRLLLSKEPTQKRRINVLEHIYGYFKKDLNEHEKAYYFSLQQDYLDYKIPYPTVLSVLYGWSIRFQQEYLLKQTIFQPYPKELVSISDSGKIS